MRLVVDGQEIEACAVEVNVTCLESALGGRLLTDVLRTDQQNVLGMVNARASTL